MRYPHKYVLYEKSVQAPDYHCEILEKGFLEVTGREARFIREDFCGTFVFSCAWVKRHAKNKALCLDIDPEPLNYGKKNHLKKLSAAQKKRIQIFQKNVISVTRPKVDMVVASNFSFYVFKEFEVLVDYFRKVRDSLKDSGVLALEMAGGGGFVEELKESTRIYREGKHWFTYMWDQQTYDPITAEGTWAIHFKFPGQKLLENVFTYDWRAWTIPEVRLALKQAGFRDSYVLWEDEDKDGEGTGEYSIVDEGKNDETWICTVLGLK